MSKHSAVRSGLIDVGNDFGIRAFGRDIAVASNCQEALATLERFLLPSMPRIQSEIVGAEIDLRVLRDGHGFRLFCNGTNEFARDLSALATQAVRLLDEAIVKCLTNLTAVHAGAVELAGRALLLPGGTHAGKSALVAELLRRGAAYLSDEYALIDAEGQAHPYPRPLLLRNGGLEQVPFLPEECNARVGNAPLMVRWIFALEYDPAAIWQIAPVPQSEALLILLRNTPHVSTESPRIVPALKRASAGSECYRGRRSNAVEAADEILRVIAE